MSSVYVSFFLGSVQDMIISRCCGNFKIITYGNIFSSMFLTFFQCVLPADIKSPNQSNFMYYKDVHFV